MVQQNYEDILVVYHAEEQGQFVAHSIRTDQIGLGPTPHEAMVEVLKALLDLFQEAAQDDQVQVWREAPSEVAALLSHKGAQKLSDSEWQSILNIFSGTCKRDSDYWEPISEYLFEDKDDEGLIWRDIQATDLHLEMV